MVSLEKFSCLCPNSIGLEMFTSKKGEKFIKCKKTSCGFFTTPEGLYEYLNTIDNLHEDLKHHHPKCRHYKPATLGVSKSDKNPSRLYFRCCEKESCKYFQWGDSPPTDTTRNIWDGKEERFQSSATNISVKVEREDKSVQTDDVEICKPKKRKKIQHKAETVEL